MYETVAELVTSYSDVLQTVTDFTATVTSTVDTTTTLLPIKKRGTKKRRSGCKPRTSASSTLTTSTTEAPTSTSSARRHSPLPPTAPTLSSTPLPVPASTPSAASPPTPSRQRPPSRQSPKRSASPSCRPRPRWWFLRDIHGSGPRDAHPHVHRPGHILGHDDQHVDRLPGPRPPRPRAGSAWPTTRGTARTSPSSTATCSTTTPARIAPRRPTSTCPPGGGQASLLSDPSLKLYVHQSSGSVGVLYVENRRRCYRRRRSGRDLRVRQRRPGETCAAPSKGFDTIFSCGAYMYLGKSTWKQDGCIVVEWKFSSSRLSICKGYDLGE